jgi:ribulose 1,5-bisphosphate synthetase/thiazole synthase
MELDEVIMIRANFENYSKNILDYTDIDMAFVKGRPVNMTVVNDTIYTHRIGPVFGGVLHSGEKAAKHALKKIKKFK